MRVVVGVHGGGHVMQGADVGRRDASLERVAGEGQSPDAPGPLSTKNAPTTAQEGHDGLSELHCIISGRRFVSS
jgi:hypothetical protein